MLLVLVAGAFEGASFALLIPLTDAVAADSFDALGDSGAFGWILRLVPGSLAESPGREAFLVGYQSRAYAARYRLLVDRVAASEERARPGSVSLQDAVARNYFALLAYKDEYEVARLHTQTAFLESVRRNFGSRARPTGR